MNTKAKVIDSKTTSKGELVALIRFNRKIPRKGEWVEVRWGAKRSLQQNSLYWVYLTWLINDAGLKDHGHFSPDALHLDLKARFISEKIMDKGQFKAIEEGTTTNMNKVEFGQYMEQVRDFMLDFFEVDSTPFFDQYMKEYRI